MDDILKISHILTDYDDYLSNWIGDYKMKLLYRASEHGFTAESFHKHCDNIQPTLVLIQDTNDYIFGGYTVAPWSKPVYPLNSINKKKENPVSAPLISEEEKAASVTVV